MAADQFKNTAGTLRDPWEKSETITLNVEFTNGVCRGIVVQTTGSVTVKYDDDSTQEFPTVNAGAPFPCRCKEITATTAGTIVAVF